MVVMKEADFTSLDTDLGGSVQLSHGLMGSRVQIPQLRHRRGGDVQRGDPMPRLGTLGHLGRTEVSDTSQSGHTPHSTYRSPLGNLMSLRAGLWHGTVSHLCSARSWLLSSPVQGCPCSLLHPPHCPPAPKLEIFKGY